ncbi:MAG TPA: hypothetical protein VMF08_11385 [Candidatus Sulfotelmatobacter sp.]|nr:hypothetical protein [Candidatus Sulfotelmatobacter sp.]
MANGGGKVVGAYNFNGTAINAALASDFDGAEDPLGITTDGTNLYVADWGSGTAAGICKFNLFTGKLESQFGVGGYGIAIYGTNLYVAGESSVSEYTVDGTLVNFSLISFDPWEPLGVAIIGTNLYVTYGDSVGKFNLDGTAVNSELIIDPSGPIALASDGTYLYIANANNGTIGKYGLDGTTNNAALISGLLFPDGLAINGSTLYVLEATGQLSSYTLDGALLNSNLISSSAFSPPCYGILTVNALGVSSAAIQSNCFTFNMTGLSNQSVVVSASTGFTNWIPVETNTLGSGPFLFSDPTWTNFPSRFYRVAAQ